MFTASAENLNSVNMVRVNDMLPTLVTEGSMALTSKCGLLTDVADKVQAVVTDNG